MVRTNDVCEVVVLHPERIQAVAARLPGAEVVEETAELFRLLGDPTRLRILLALSLTEELCVCDLAELVGLSLSAVSHQLRRLRAGGLVRFRREGRLAYYRLTDHPALALLEGILTSAETT